MAEVARGVLHNAGNVMNSITTATFQIESAVEKSSPDGLEKLVELLKTEKDLGAFFATDKRANQVLPYLEKILQAQRSYREVMQSEIGVLQSGIGHLSGIIQSQHAFADKPNFVESIDPTCVVNDSINLVNEAFARHGVTLTSEFQTVPSVLVDRNRLTQVILNFLTNAKDALKANDPGNRKIHIELLKLTDGNVVRIRVSDNGPGVPIHLKDKIFSSGFTTKDSGLGHGLHYCAVSAMELGWKIGLDTNLGEFRTIFYLDIPFENSQTNQLGVAA